MASMVQCHAAMVRLTVVLLPSPRGARKLVEGLRSLLIGTRLEDGCLGCSVWSDPDSTVNYFEEWATEADVRRRIRSEQFKSLLVLMEASQEPPQVRFDFLNRTRGFDYVSEVLEEEGQGLIDD